MCAETNETISITVIKSYKKYSTLFFTFVQNNRLFFKFMIVMYFKVDREQASLPSGIKVLKISI